MNAEIEVRLADHRPRANKEMTDGDLIPSIQRVGRAVGFLLPSGEPILYSFDEMETRPAHVEEGVVLIHNMEQFHYYREKHESVEFRRVIQTGIQIQTPIPEFPVFEIPNDGLLWDIR